MSATFTRQLAAIRTAIHPIDRLRRFAPTRALLRVCDVEVGAESMASAGRSARGL